MFFLNLFHSKNYFFFNSIILYCKYFRCYLNYGNLFLYIKHAYTHIAYLYDLCQHEKQNRIIYSFFLSFLG